MKRIFLFLITNIAIMVVLSITLRILGVDNLLKENGSDLNINALVIFSGIFGFGGAFISLAISKWMAKRMTGAKVIEQPANNVETWLLETVKNGVSISIKSFLSIKSRIYFVTLYLSRRRFCISSRRKSR